MHVPARHLQTPAPILRPCITVQRYLVTAQGTTHEPVIILAAPAEHMAARIALGRKVVVRGHMVRGIILVARGIILAGQVVCRWTTVIIRQQTTTRVIPVRPWWGLHIPIRTETAPVLRIVTKIVRWLVPVMQHQIVRVIQHVHITHHMFILELSIIMVRAVHLVGRAHCTHFRVIPDIM